MAKLELDKRKPVHITVSRDSCEKKCKHCYINTIIQSNTTSLMHITTLLDICQLQDYTIQTVAFNINHTSDIEYMREFIHKYKQYILLAHLYCIVPIDIVLSNMINIPTHIGVAISVNIHDSKHRDAMKSPFPNISKSAPIEISVTSSCIAEFSHHKIANSVVSMIKSAVKQNIYIPYVLINYIPEDGHNHQEMMLSIISIGNIISNIPMNVQWAACMQPYDGKPCETLNLIEVIDNEVMAFGCPYPGVKQCQMLV